MVMDLLHIIKAKANLDADICYMESTMIPDKENGFMNKFRNILKLL